MRTGLLEESIRKHLLTLENRVPCNLRKKLISYATGRMIEPTVCAEGDRMFQQVREKKGGHGDLCHLMVQSRILQAQ